MIQEIGKDENPVAVRINRMIAAFVIDARLRRSGLLHALARASFTATIGISLIAERKGGARICAARRDSCAGPHIADAQWNRKSGLTLRDRTLMSLVDVADRR
ncbi:hypothetical protein [Burkholderia ambifaria]|uniref:hypothetical protein n=1 Tax=Burkholderia ambifaria TaxID=152480 RepID=UPI001E2923E6|nr:hypothetical protein [Burkholderia ambifaria]UEP25802.1 hypothetical protein LL999_33080 [Burkholderia ambifaria]WAS58539.1 hypothetical protein MK974_32440 [Burkholderia ambifaria]WDR97725.1 hypothetical protein OR985_02895 [Burkholderia ambifaria]